MTNLKNDQTIKELEKENIELKFSSVRADIQSFKHDIKTQLDLILAQTSKTNGSVAKVMKDIHDIQQENIERDRALDEFKAYKKGTSFWYLIQTNKWIIIPLFLSLYVLSNFELCSPPR